MLAAIDVNGLSIFAELGLLLFLGVFVAVTVRALRAPRGEMTTCARMPLDETPAGSGDTNDGRGAR